MPISEELATLHAPDEEGVITPDEFAQAKAICSLSPRQAPLGILNASTRSTPARPSGDPDPVPEDHHPKALALLSAATIALLWAADGGSTLVKREPRARVGELKQSMMNPGPAWEEITDQLCSEIPNLCGNW